MKIKIYTIYYFYNLVINMSAQNINICKDKYERQTKICLNLPKESSMIYKINSENMKNTYESCALRTIFVYQKCMTNVVESKINSTMF
jgi:hypothetical protein